MGSQCILFTRVSASVKTTSAFSLVWRHNVCVSHACLRRLRRLLRIPWYGVTMHAFHTVVYRLRWLLRFAWYLVTMHAFHTRVCIYQDGFWVFLGMASQGMRFTRVSALVKTTCVFLGMVLQWMRFICVSASVKTAFAFPWYGVTMHAFQTRVCMGSDVLITMHAFHTGFCVDQDGFGVFLCMVSQCMRHTRLHLSDGFRVFLGMGSQCMRFTCVSASVTTTSAFPWYGVTMNAFQTRGRIS